MLTSAADLAALPVLDADGATVVLGSLWRGQPAVLVFVRHFGCIFCREHATEIQRRLGELHAAGAEVHVIGNGAPNFIEGFREATGWTGPVYTDPTRAVYDAAQLKRGLMTIVNPMVLGRALRALARGYRQVGTQGDATQQGGTLIVTPDSRVLWHHVSSSAGDHAGIDSMLGALRSSPRSSAPSSAH